jgi:hypothetical protein
MKVVLGSEQFGLKRSILDLQTVQNVLEKEQFLLLPL